jgi:hypothetical protein
MERLHEQGATSKLVTQSFETPCSHSSTNEDSPPEQPMRRHYGRCAESIPQARATQILGTNLKRMPAPTIRS